LLFHPPAISLPTRGWRGSFQFYEDFDTEEMKIHLVRIVVEEDALIFKEETIGTTEKKGI